MGRGKMLSQEEIIQIMQLKCNGENVSKIAKKLKRSRCVIQNFLRNPQKYGKKKSTGRPAALTAKEKRLILRKASNSGLTPKQIALDCRLNVSIKTVKRVIQRASHLKRKKFSVKPPLTEKHKAARLSFAIKHIQWIKKWRRVIFTDEKKFNLDGPDGYKYYFHDLRKEEKVLSRRQYGGGAVMIWAGVGYKGNTEIKFIQGRMNSANYLNLIKEQIETYAHRIAGRKYIFQQDNAAVHTARIVKNYFQAENINVLDWPARSPDLNIIENVWGKLSRMLYEGGKQFNTVSELKSAILEAWESLDQNYIQNLYKSLPKRMIEVVQRKGQSTHY